MAPPPALLLTRLMLRDFRSYPALTRAVPRPHRRDLRRERRRQDQPAGGDQPARPRPRPARRAHRRARPAGGGAGRRCPGPSPGRFESAAPGPASTSAPAPPEGGPPERRVFRLDGAPARSQAELAERVATVWLTPQMDRLFQDGASDRRRFLDRLVWALEPHHAREVAALRERHGPAQPPAGQERRDGRADPAWLAALEDAMARHGVAAAAARRGAGRAG